MLILPPVTHFLHFITNLCIASSKLFPSTIHLVRKAYLLGYFAFFASEKPPYLQSIEASNGLPSLLHAFIFDKTKPKSSPFPYAHLHEKVIHPCYLIERCPLCHMLIHYLISIYKDGTSPNLCLCRLFSILPTFASPSSFVYTPLFPSPFHTYLLAASPKAS